MLTVYNVQQGDSMLLAGMGSRNCCFDNEPLLIDCGLRKQSVHAKIASSRIQVRVLVTHADRDHIGGLADVLTSHDVTRLYIPRYLPEIERIESYFRKSTARKIAPVLATAAAVRRIEVAEGDRLCSHSLVMNPPKRASQVLNRIGFDEPLPSDLPNAVSALQEAGIELDAREIIRYSPEPITWNPERPELDNRRPSGFRERKLFFQNFFILLARMVQSGGQQGDGTEMRVRHDFRDTGSDQTNAIISNAFRITSNQASIVFRYDGTSSFLFTGDADDTVFERIAAAGYPIAAKYLKVPHHGSKHNFGRSSLNKIKPKVAIVSHGNKKFGRDPDSHPHIETIKLLKKHNVTTHFTNDVVKTGGIIRTATIGKTSCGYLFFK